MLAQLASYFWPSKRSARRRIFGFSAFASLSLPWLCIALYYVLIWWLRGYFDRRQLAWAHQAAESAASAPPPQAPTTRGRPLKLPRKLD
jgi:hypothetical protein